MNYLNIISYLQRYWYFVLFAVIIISFLLGFFLSGGISGSLVTLNAADSGDLDLMEPLASDNLDIPNDISTIIVDLSGAVQSPGIYKLESNARLFDLLQAGGGVTSDVSYAWVTRNLNLSSKLIDSQKVYVPFEWDIHSDKEISVLPIAQETPISTITPKASSASNNSDTTSPKININTASKDELDTLPGIGPAYAQKLIDNRPYKNLDDLENKKVLSTSVLEKIKNLIDF